MSVGINGSTTFTTPDVRPLKQFNEIANEIDAAPDYTSSKKRRRSSPNSNDETDAATEGSSSKKNKPSHHAS